MPPPDDGLHLTPTGDHDERAEERFAAMKEAVMLASDEKPGWRVDAILVMSVWVKDPPEPGAPAQADMFCTPPQRTGNLLKVLQAIRWEEPDA